MNKFINYPLYLKITCVLLSIVVFSYIAILLENIFVPLFLGLLVASLLVPFSQFLENKFKFSRGVSSIIVVLIALSVLVGVLFLIGMQLTHLEDEWPAFQNQLMDSVGVVQEWVYTKFGIAKEHQMNYIESAASNSLKTGTDILGAAMSSISTLLMFIVFTFLYSVFLLIYRGHLVRFIMMLFPDQHRIKVLDTVNAIQHMVKKYLVGLLLQMIIVSTLALVAFAILDIKYSLMLAVITGILNVLPYVGILIALIVTMLITFATATGAKVAFVLLAFVIIHAIDGNIVMPKIVGSKVKVNSLVVIIGLILGEMAWGISGMLLAIPTLAIIKIVCDRVESLRPWGYLLGEERTPKEIIVEEEIKEDLE
ncbi:AI-2E family transporter [Myroides sp. M-43]|uniref:AI-2E family transporter n=1 Tax=Myroides oncorhynchi TaxID=2893756 RepID=UPI001E46DB35|nr:AI-2E family transporter [Myroides oncorhynchi]MCC9042240.1 AI-2E family transporter [Myroides oncorhynchi]